MRAGLRILEVVTWLKAFVTTVQGCLRQRAYFCSRFCAILNKEILSNDETQYTFRSDDGDGSDGSGHYRYRHPFQSCSALGRIRFWSRCEFCAPDGELGNEMARQERATKRHPANLERTGHQQHPATRVDCR